MHNFSIKSHLHSYDIEFNNILDFQGIRELGTHFIVDRNVIRHINGDLPNAIYLDACETTKTYDGVIGIFQSLLDLGLQRNHVLVGIGGGIIQDITCWIAATFMRGITWNFIPTTLLAQADSCIGSKSSINFKTYKNILGSFYPPKKIIINNNYLNTLAEVDIRSGMAEIIKLLIIDKFDFNQTPKDLNEMIFKSLMIKKRFIEEDEFDKNTRNILNYGHCFGHALESITGFMIPHGIAVAIGMDMANALADLENNLDDFYFKKYHSILKPLYYDFLDLDFNIGCLLDAISKDKKNVGDLINIILPYKNKLEKTKRIIDSNFKQNCKTIFDKLRT